MLLAGGLLGAAALGPRLFRRPFAVSAAAVFGLCALRPGPSGPERGFSIEALDVGQGDAILLRWKRRAILVDGGGPFDVEATEFGRTRVLPKLLDRGVTRLDAVLLTHPHPDHALGLFVILEELPVGELWRSDGADESGFHADLTALADRRGVPTRVLRTGDARELDGARISVLHSGGPMRKNDGVNNQSVVALVERDGRSALLTGDIGKPAEDALREAGAAPRADVLKVAHHGSRTSTRPGLRRCRRAEAGASLLRPPQPVRPSCARDSRDSRAPLRTAASDGHAVRLPRRASPRGDPAGLERPGETLSGESAGKPDLLVIVGPTGSGKTDLAHAVALAREGEIVSADAFAVYRGLDVGTAKPPPVQRSEVRYHMLDVAGPEEPYSAGRFASEARPIVDDVAGRGRLPIVCGGSGFYVSALLTGLPPAPALAEGLRPALARWARSSGPEAAHRFLAVNDPVSADRIPVANLKYTLRALEVLLSTGSAASARSISGDALGGKVPGTNARDPPFPPATPC